MDFDYSTIELLKQAGAVATIAIIMVKASNRNFQKMLDSILEDNKTGFKEIIEKLDNLIHKQDHTYLSKEEVSDLFDDISEKHKLKKFKNLVHFWESIRRGSIDFEGIEDELQSIFKTISKEEAIRLNKIKSMQFNKDLGTKFINLIQWPEFISKTMEILRTSENISDLESKFFSLCDRFLVAIKTELSI